MDDLISRQAAIDALDVGAELLRRVLDDADVVGAERYKYKWGLGLIESYISDMKELPSAQQTTCKYWDTESDFCALYRPAAQPEIITCKDCKHGMYDVMCKFYWCHGVAHSANWFCADGKRRE